MNAAISSRRGIVRECPDLIGLTLHLLKTRKGCDEEEDGWVTRK